MILSQGDISKYDYASVARQFQTAIADIAQTLPQMCTTVPKQSKGQCSSDASIGVGYSHSANARHASDEAEELNEQTSRGSKRSADVLDVLLQEDLQDDRDTSDDTKRAKCMDTRMLSHEEKLERRREGNRRAAQRLRQRRMETVSRLQAEINRLEQERLVYLNHIYQLAASARSVVAENKELRGRLEAFQSGSSALAAEAVLPRAAGGKGAAAAAALLSRGGKAGGNGSSSAATSRMDFDAVRRELFVPADTPVWPFP
ncbi:g6109 [Coccomyxa elongata]